MPPEVSLLCPGEELTITCGTNDTNFLEWNLTFSISGMTESRTRLVSSIGQFETSSIPANDQNMMTIFHFLITRRSDSGSIPLISTLSVSNVTANNYLNGTEVHCIESYNSTVELDRFVTTIHVFKLEHGIGRFQFNLQLS